MKCIPLASVLQTTDRALYIEREYVVSFQRICVSKLCACTFFCALSFGAVVHIGTGELSDRRTI
jgi:hypothetical protein